MGVVIFECCVNSLKHGQRNQSTKHLEQNNIKKNAQCVHTIASVCSPKIGNDWQPWNLLNKLTKISCQVQIWEQFITMGAIIYSREFIEYDKYLNCFYAINLRVLCSCYANMPE